MNLIVIIILTVVLVLTFLLVTLLLYLFQKHRKLVLNNFVKDLSNSYKDTQIKNIAAKQLPIDSSEIKEDIYFCTRAVVGKYEKVQKVINEKNWSVDQIENSKIKMFYHYKIINLGSSKFVPLNKIDVLLSQSNLYLFHPLEAKIISLKKMKNITIFWEKNLLMQQKDYFPGVAFTYQKEDYFLLFETYKTLVKFLTYLNLLIS